MGEKKETLVDPLKLAASGTAAVGTTLLGSVFGDSGTLIGVFIGSIESGIIAAYFEHGARKAAAIRLHRAKPDFLNARLGLAVGAVTMAGVVGFIGITEAATGKTLHGDITNTADYGSTFSHTAKSPAPAPVHSSPDDSYSHAYTPSPSATSSASVSASPSVSPSAVPSLSPSSATAITVSPATSTALPSVTPAASSPVQPAPTASGQ